MWSSQIKKKKIWEDIGRIKVNHLKLSYDYNFLTSNYTLSWSVTSKFWAAKWLITIPFHAPASSNLIETKSTIQSYYKWPWFPPRSSEVLFLMGSSTEICLSFLSPKDLGFGGRNRYPKKKKKKKFNNREEKSQI